MQVESWGTCSQWCLELGLGETDLVSGSHGLTRQQLSPPVPLAHIPLGGMWEHWKSKSESTCELRYRQLKRESKSHAPKQSKTRNVDRQMFYYLQENRAPSGVVGTWQGKSPLLCMSPAFSLGFYVLNMMPYVEWSIPVGSWVQLSQLGPLSTPSTAPAFSLLGWDEVQKRPQQCVNPAQQQLKHLCIINTAAASLFNHSFVLLKLFAFSSGFKDVEICFFLIWWNPFLQSAETLHSTTGS